MMMRLLASIVILIFILIQTSCGSSTKDLDVNSANRYSGKIEPAGITTYQYGSHKLVTKDSFYALRSEQVDLNQYENQEVTIIANKIEGYPVDGGPVYLNVEKVEN